MEPNHNSQKGSKRTECPIEQQINKYRNPLPQISRSENHFFFKEIIHQLNELAYVTIGFSVGHVPFHLMDLFAVIINEIHCCVDANLKLIIDGDQLWVTSTVGVHISEVGNLRNNIEQANTSLALQKTRGLLQSLLIDCDKNIRVEDKKVLQNVRNIICKKISQCFKNPHIDD